MTLDIDHLRHWIGRTETAADTACLAPLRALAATLNRADPPNQPGDLVPACWHWTYFLPVAQQSDLGSDGHPKRGGFLPPVPLARRMWAGSQLEFLTPLRVGQTLQRHSRIEDVQLRQGRSGSLVFVKVRHDIVGDGKLAIVEHHDIVYRDLPAPNEPASACTAAPGNADWSRQITPDAVLLFRYSALTFNGHRIHYDRHYAMQAEGYPGLVVHGPLIATLLLDLLRCHRPDATVRQFRFRAVKPLFDIAPFDVCGRMTDSASAALWSCDATGHLTMQASATLA